MYIGVMKIMMTRLGLIKVNDIKIVKDYYARAPVSPTNESRHVFPEKEIKPILPNADQDWRQVFESMNIQELQTLLELVGSNEYKEIESIRLEFEPRVHPILEALQFRPSNKYT